MGYVLVTGGAGYIGSVVCNDLLKKGEKVHCYDNLANGDLNLLPRHENFKFFKGDLKDVKSLEFVFHEYNIDKVIHLAAHKAAGESEQNPGKYSDNIINMINLLRVIVKYDVKKLVFSSSATVYGNPSSGFITEDEPVKPNNFYGHTKEICEALIKKYAEVHGFNYVILRYFNVAGDVLGHIDKNPQNVLPILMKAVVKTKREGQPAEFRIFGDDYLTPDGTCVRDYIHVQDISNAHIKSLWVSGNHILNLGSGEPCSVEELVEKVQELTGTELIVNCGKRRPGDPDILVSAYDQAKTTLEWCPKYDIKDMILSMYEAYKKADY